MELKQKIKNFIGLGVFCTSLALAATAQSKSFTVSTVAALEQAVSEASTNKEDNEILLESGVYFLTQPLAYIPTQFNQSEECTHLAIKGNGLAVIDGSQQDKTAWESEVFIRLDCSLSDAQDPSVVKIQNISFQHLDGFSVSAYVYGSSQKEPSVVIEDSNFLNNTGGISFSTGDSVSGIPVNLTLHRNIFKDNVRKAVRADHVIIPEPAVIDVSGKAGKTSIIGNVFAANTLTHDEEKEFFDSWNEKNGVFEIDGGAVRFRGSQLDLIHNTFVDNTILVLESSPLNQIVAHGAGLSATLYQDNPNPSLKVFNNLFFNNTVVRLGSILYSDDFFIHQDSNYPIEVVSNNFSTFGLSNCADTNNCQDLSLIGNLNVNPLLNGYHLTANSPVINMGTANLPVPLPLTDIDHEMRLNGIRPDIGADEYYRCGDGILQIFYGEACDDGNHIDGDGCSASCKLEESWPYDHKPEPVFDKDPFEGDPYPGPSPKEVEPLGPISRLPILQRP